MMRTFGLILFAALVWSLPLSATQPAQPANNGNLPSLHVESLTLDKTAYAVGETVKGRFTLANGSPGASGEIKYLVSLVEFDPTGKVSVGIYGRIQSAPFELAGISRKEIEFAYPITAAPSGGNLGIHIRVAMKDGAGLAEAKQPVEVSGGVAMVRLLDGFILVNGQHKYGLQDSPTVGEADAVNLLLTLSNPSKTDMEVHPQVTLLDRARNKVVKAAAITGEPVVIKPGGMAAVRIDLPVKGLKSRTYLAEIYFADQNGKQRSSCYYAWYTVQERR
jgi:hypothetical protein